MRVSLTLILFLTCADALPHGRASALSLLPSALLLVAAALALARGLGLRELDGRAAGLDLGLVLFVIVASRVGDERAARALREGQALARLVEVNVYEVAESNLLRRHEVRERVDEETLDG